MGFFDSEDSENKKKRKLSREAGNEAIALQRLQQQSTLASQKAAEAARSTTLGLLGTPGTYEAPYDVFAHEQIQAGNPLFSGGFLSLGDQIFDKTRSDLIKLRNLIPQTTIKAGLIKNKGSLKSTLRQLGVNPNDFSEEALQEFAKNPTASALYRGKYAVRGGSTGRIAEAETPPILDPDAYSQYLLSTPSGRATSYATAKSQGLLRGAFGEVNETFNTLRNNIMVRINRDAQQAVNDAEQQILRQVAKKGTSRRIALRESLLLRQQADVNERVASVTADAMQALIQFSIDNWRLQESFNQAWVSNQGYIRDAVQQSFQQINEYFGSVLVPNITANADRAYELSLVEKNNTLAKIITGVTSIGLGAITGGVIGGAAGSLMGAASSAAGLIGEQAQADRFMNLIPRRGQKVESGGIGLSNISTPPPGATTFGRGSIGTGPQLDLPSVAPTLFGAG